MNPNRHGTALVAGTTPGLIKTPTTNELADQPWVKTRRTARGSGALLVRRSGHSWRVPFGAAISAGVPGRNKAARAVGCKNAPTASASQPGAHLLPPGSWESPVPSALGRSGSSARVCTPPGRVPHFACLGSRPKRSSGSRIPDQTQQRLRRRSARIAFLRKSSKLCKTPRSRHPSE